MSFQEPLKQQKMSPMKHLILLISGLLLFSHQVHSQCTDEDIIDGPKSIYECSYALNVPIDVSYTVNNGASLSVSTPLEIQNLVISGSSISFTVLVDNSWSNIEISSHGGTCQNTTLIVPTNAPYAAFYSLISPSSTTDQTICLGSPIEDIDYNVNNTLTATNLPPGLTILDPSSNPKITGTPSEAGVYDVTLSIHPFSPCQIVDFNIKITVLPAGPAPIVGEDTTCLGQEITFTNDSLGGVWSVSDPAIGSINPMGVFIPTTTGNCGGGTVSHSVEVKGQATQLTLTSEVGSDQQESCIETELSNITYTLTGTATNIELSSGSLPAGITSQFDTGVITISGTATESGTFNYTLTTNGSTCGAEQSINGTITIVEPIVTMFSIDESYCQGDSVGKFPEQSDNTPPILGIWSSPLSTQILGEHNYIFTPNDNECATTYETNITINSYPATKFEYKVIGDSIYFNSISESADPGVIWTYGTLFDKKSTEDTLTILYVPGQSYTIQLQTENSCGKDSITQTIQVNSLVDYVNEEIHIYPNPVNDKLNIIHPGTGSLTVSVNDIHGKSVYQAVFDSNNMQINLGGMEQGYYQLLIEQNGHIYHQKIMKID